MSAIAVLNPHAVWMVAAVTAVAVAGQCTAVLVAQVDQMLEQMVVEWCGAMEMNNGQTRAQQSTKMHPYTWSMGKRMVVIGRVVGNIDNDV